jgi:uncharacterized membrane protein YdjX (TVP38/TMEM64 family)
MGEQNVGTSSLQVRVRCPVERRLFREFLTVASADAQAQRMPSEAPARKKPPLLKLALAAIALAVAGLLLLRGVDLHAWVDRGMDVIRSAGPVAFFLAMALLPAAGVPMLAFTLTVGSAFGDRLGMPLVIALTILAMTCNVALTYALARKALRPLLSWLMTRLGYKLPRVESGDATDLIVILRVTPGVPFFVQNYLLGLAEVPFGRYMAVSCLIFWPYSAAFVLFGDALINGRGKMVLLAVGAIVAVGAATHMVRKHYARKKVTS